jgi:hypothetical protein
MLEQRNSIHAQADFDARVLQPFRLRRVPGVDADDALAAGREKPRDRRPGSR